MSEEEFASALTALSGMHVSPGAIRAWEQRVNDPPGRILWAALRLGGIDVLALMEPGIRMVGVGDSDETALAVESHKFIPVYCPPAVTEQLFERFPDRDRFGVADGTISPFRMHVFPFGVAVFHLVEQMEFGGIARLAAWRRASYQAVRETVDACIAGFSGGAATDSAKYIFSLFKVLSHPWAPETLETALRLVAMPGVLLPRTARRPLSPDEITKADGLERELIQSGKSPTSGDMVSFGIEGISHGYASWAGLAYHPLAAEQALDCASLVTMEILTQALWCYSSHVIDRGEALSSSDARALAVHSARLLSPSGRESIQSCSAREAIIATSRIRAMLDQVGTALTKGN